MLVKLEAASICNSDIHTLQVYKHQVITTDNIEDREVLVKLEATSICISDINTFLVCTQFRKDGTMYYQSII